MAPINCVDVKAKNPQASDQKRAKTFRNYFNGEVNTVP